LIKEFTAKTLKENHMDILKLIEGNWKLHTGVEKAKQSPDQTVSNNC